MTNATGIASSFLHFSSYDNEYIDTFFKLNGVISLVLGSFGIYLVQFKSPHLYSHYKNFLLNVAVWMFCVDVYISIILRPKFLFPALVFCPTGWLQTDDPNMAGIWLSFLWIFLGGVNIALISALVYRYASLTADTTKVLTCSFLLFLAFMHSTRALPVIISYYIASHDRTSVRRAILTQWPNIRRQISATGCAVVHTSVAPGAAHTFNISVGLLFGLTLPLILFFLGRCFHLLQNLKRSITSEAFRVHNETLVCIVFQICIPFATFCIPYCLIQLLTAFGVESVSTLTQMMVIFMSANSSINTIVMLCCIHSYRKASKDMLSKFKLPKCLVHDPFSAAANAYNNAENTIKNKVGIVH